MTAENLHLYAEISNLATISFPGRPSISFVDGEDPPIALDLCTSVSLVFYLIFIIFSVRQRHGATWEYRGGLWRYKRARLGD